MPRRRGGTLLAVMLTVIVLAAMGAALAQRAVAHVEVARAHARTDAARAAADGAIVAAWHGWDGVQRGNDAVGAVATQLASADSAAVVVSIVHPSARLWWVSAAAWTPGGAGGRLVARSSGMALWIRVAAPVPLAAISGAGEVDLAPLARLVGPALPPSGWNCPLAPALEAIVFAPPATLRSPPGAVVGGIALPSSSLTDVPAAWAAERSVIAGQADVVLPGDTTLETPTLADSTLCASGWGSPDRTGRGPPCPRRFVVAHARGALTLRGVGQGVLQVDGPLVLDDGARLTGLVIARGPVTLRGSARLTGALVLVGGAGSRVSLLDSARVEGSGCAVAGALAGGTLLTEVPAHAWYRLR